MLEYFVNTYATELLALVMCAILGTLGWWLKGKAGLWFDTEEKLAVARIAAQFVEQVWKQLHGADKLQKALETARELLDKKGIPFDPTEMTVIIEAAVAEFNEAFKKPLLAADTADAVRTTEDSDTAEPAQEAAERPELPDPEPEQETADAES